MHFILIIIVLFPLSFIEMYDNLNVYLLCVSYAPITKEMGIGFKKSYELRITSF